MQCKRIFCKIIFALSENHLPRNYLFQNDNDSKNTCQTVAFTKNSPVLEWQAQSPDLNPFENPQNELDKHMRIMNIPIQQNIANNFKNSGNNYILYCLGYVD